MHRDGSGKCKICGHSREIWLKQDLVGIEAGHEFGKSRLEKWRDRLHRKEKKNLMRISVEQEQKEREKGKEEK